MARRSSSKNNFSDIDKLSTAIAKVSRLKKKIKTSVKVKLEANTKDLDKLKIQSPLAVEAAHKRTLLLVAEELELALGLAMESPVWQWDYGDGDIVDTGELRDSVSVLVVNDSLRVTYNKEYAAIVHFGGYIHPYGNPHVQIYMPGRPWITSVLTGGGPVEKFNFELFYFNYFSKFLAEELKSRGIT